MHFESFIQGSREEEEEKKHCTIIAHYLNWQRDINNVILHEMVKKYPITRRMYMKNCNLEAA